MVRKLQISSPSSPIFKKPSIQSSLETEALFGELFYVKTFYKKWVYGFLKTDNYYGWLKSKYLDNPVNCTHKVISIRSIILEKPNIKSRAISYLPMCSLIKVIQEEGEWAEIEYIKSGILKKGYIPLSEIILKNKNKLSWEKTALQLLDIPYKWGGRDTLAIDCSSLIQIICNTEQIYLPRNSNDQMHFLKENFISKIIDENLYGEIISKRLLKKGSLIFWEGHVGILINDNTLLHANAFHKNTSKENIYSAIERFLLQNLNIRLICNIFG